LTGAELGHLRARSLLIVGAAGRDVLKLNESAYKRLTCMKIAGRKPIEQDPAAFAHFAVFD
jgi:hypothetical protein